jgi:predicted nucleotidyltransferase
MMKLLELKIEVITKLCIHPKVAKLFAFNSVLNDSFNKENDIDLIVDFEDVSIYGYTVHYIDLKFESEQVFNRSVDLFYG